MFRNSSRPTATALGQSLKAKLRRFLTEFRIIRRALVHRRVPWHAKAISGCALLYVVSPIQVIPNFIPVIGQMDDVAVVILALKYLRRFVPQSVLDECERGSSVAVIATIGVTGADGTPTERTIISSVPRAS